MENIIIRPYCSDDEEAVIELWLACELVVPHNNPRRDIERKLQVNPEWFLVGELGGEIVATCMAGYEGHRGWINYLAVSPGYHQKGLGRKILHEAERLLMAAGCPKINLQVREGNKDVIEFYRRIGYKEDAVMSMGKRLEMDEPFGHG
jgi:ribosomal protein S18 acetylase RimI-like enzyme